MDDTGNVLMKKVGPLPLVVWVVGASGVVFLFLLMKGKGSANTAANNQTNQVSALAPTEAEAFGTLEQQQQDVSNALTTLGNNQSALGGSLSTLTGIVTQQGSDNAASFQNLVNGQQSIQQGQASAASAADNYYTALLSNIQNYGNSLGSQLNGISSAQAQAATTNQNNFNAVQAALSQNFAGVSQMLGNIQSQQQADALAQRYGFANTDALLAYMFYSIPNRSSINFGASVYPSQNLQMAQNPA